VEGVEESSTPVHDAAARRARGYSWETTREGNFLAIKDARNSPRIVSRLAGQLVALVIAERPDLAPFPFALRRWATAETIAALIVRRLDDIGVIDETGEVRERLNRERRAEERRAAEEARALGLDPVSLARLARDRAEAALSGFDVEAAIAKGREVIDARAVHEGGDG